MIMIGFKNKHPFKQRKIDCVQILSKYPDRIPVICEKNPYSKNAPDIDKNKYLVDHYLTLAQFISVIRKRMSLKPEVGLYIFVNGSIPSNSSFVYNLFLDNKDDDGFLYITYDIENTFGNNYDFKENDVIYLIKNNITDKNISYTIRNVEIIKGGDWHDGYSETYYGLLENNITKIIEKKQLAYINFMCQIQNIYAIKI
jgi:GABA(A) receptor-associated protein